MSPREALYALPSAAYAFLRLPVRRPRRETAVRAERAARPRHPAEAAPIFVACCEMWWLTSGRHHERTCHIVSGEIDQ